MNLVVFFFELSCISCTKHFKDLKNVSGWFWFAISCANKECIKMNADGILGPLEVCAESVCTCLIFV